MFPTTLRGIPEASLLLLVVASGCAGSKPVPETPGSTPTSAPTKTQPQATSQTPPGAAPLTIDDALALRERGQQVEGLAVLEQVRTEALARGDAATAAQALHRAGDLLADLRRWCEAHEAYAKALEEHLAAGEGAWASRAANDLGLLHGGCGRAVPGACNGCSLEVSRRWFGEAVTLAEKAGSFERARRSANNLGVSHFYREEFDTAVERWQQALEFARKAGDAAGEAQEHTNLALLWALRAEGGFPSEGPEAAPPAVDPKGEAEQKARLHFAAALEAAERAGKPADWVCGMFGRYGNRCERLAPAEAPSN